MLGKINFMKNERKSVTKHRRSGDKSFGVLEALDKVVKKRVNTLSKTILLLVLLPLLLLSLQKVTRKLRVNHDRRLNIILELRLIKYVLESSRDTEPIGY